MDGGRSDKVGIIGKVGVVMALDLGCQRCIPSAAQGKPMRRGYVTLDATLPYHVACRKEVTMKGSRTIPKEVLAQSQWSQMGEMTVRAPESAPKADASVAYADTASFKL